MPSRAPVAGTLLAFDFGLQRIGVAVGEPALGTAHPLPAIAAAGAARFEPIRRLIEEWQPARLVVGVPRSVDGTAHVVTRQAEHFARQLEGRFGLPVERVDERYSSREAESRLRGVKRKAVDSVAAQIILEQYLDEHAA